MKFTSEIFKKLYDLDIKGLVEQDYKGLTYLSWATAWKLLQEQDEQAEYEVLRDSNQMPFFSRDGVHFVYTRIKAFETVKEMYLPVMNNNHQAVAQPNSTQVNNAIQRCLAKNVAMFGIGLKLYVGEDLEDIIKPTVNTPKTSKNEPKQQKATITPMNIQKASDEQITLIGTLMTLTGSDPAKLLSYYKVDTYNELTDVQANEVINAKKIECKKKNIPFEEVN